MRQLYRGKQMNLAKRILDKSKIFGTFTLRSGKVSDSHFDKYQFESDPVLLSDIAKEMVKLIPKEIEILAGLEMGGVPIVTILSQISGLHCAFIRKQPKEYGTCRYSEGADLSARKILLVEDVVSSGGAIIDATSMLRNDGIEVTKALCVIDRETGGYEKLQEVGIELLSLFKQSEIDRKV
ncbi:MAG: orotate phosphoribosyltransferase [Proteobacteria bacterium]|nr:orotate phosphoribosyltransferase [Pseudomonadota bacterium]